MLRPCFFQSRQAYNIFLWSHFKADPYHDWRCMFEGALLYILGMAFCLRTQSLSRVWKRRESPSWDPRQRPCASFPGSTQLGNLQSMQMSQSCLVCYYLLLEETNPILIETYCTSRPWLAFFAFYLWRFFLCVRAHLEGLSWVNM